jgi:hypothetical protein
MRPSGIGGERRWWRKVWGRRTTDFTDWTDQLYSPRSTRLRISSLAILLILLRSRGGQNHQPPGRFHVLLQLRIGFHVPISGYFRNARGVVSMTHETKSGRIKSWASDINFRAYPNGKAATSSAVVRSAMESSRSAGDGPCPEELAADYTAAYRPAHGRPKARHAF